MLFFISYFLLYRSVWYVVRLADQAIAMVTFSTRVATSRRLRAFYSRRVWRYRGAMVAVFALFSFVFVFTYYGTLFYVEQYNRQLQMTENGDILWSMANASYLMMPYTY